AGVGRQYCALSALRLHADAKPRSEGQGERRHRGGHFGIEIGRTRGNRVGEAPAELWPGAGSGRRRIPSQLPVQLSLRTSWFIVAVLGGLSCFEIRRTRTIVAPDPEQPHRFSVETRPRSPRPRDHRPNVTALATIFFSLSRRAYQLTTVHATHQRRARLLHLGR